MISRRSFARGAGGAAPALSPAAPSARATAGTKPRTRREGLRFRLPGRLLLPGQSACPLAEQLSSAEFDAVDPAAVAYCASAADVAVCLAFVRDEGLPFTARSGGHSAAGFSTTADLAIDVSRLNSLTIKES